MQMQNQTLSPIADSCGHSNYCFFCKMNAQLKIKQYQYEHKVKFIQKETTLFFNPTGTKIYFKQQQKEKQKKINPFFIHQQIQKVNFQQSPQVLKISSFRQKSQKKLQQKLEYEICSQEQTKSKQKQIQKLQRQRDYQVIDNVKNLNSENNSQKSQKKKKRKKKSKIQNTDIGLTPAEFQNQKIRNQQIKNIQQQQQASIQAQIHANQYLNSFDLKNRTNQNSQHNLNLNNKHNRNNQHNSISPHHSIIKDFKVFQSTQLQSFSSSFQNQKYFSQIQKQKENLIILFQKFESVIFQLIDFVSYEMMECHSNTFNFQNFSIKYPEQYFSQKSPIIKKQINKKFDQNSSQQQLKRRSLSLATLNFNQLLNILKFFQNVYEKVNQKLQIQLDKIGMNQLEKVLIQKSFRQQFTKKLLLYLPELKDFFILFQEKVKQKNNRKDNKNKKQGKKIIQFSDQIKTKDFKIDSNLCANVFLKSQQNSIEIQIFQNLLKTGSICPMIRFISLQLSSQQQSIKTNQFFTSMNAIPKLKKLCYEQKQQKLSQLTSYQPLQNLNKKYQSSAFDKNEHLFEFQLKESKKQIQHRKKLNKQLQKQKQKTFLLNKKINNLAKTLKEKYPNQKFSLDLLKELQEQSSMNLNRFLKTSKVTSYKQQQQKQKQKTSKFQFINESFDQEQVQNKKQNESFVNLYRFLENLKIPPINKLIHCRVEDSWKLSITKKINKKTQNNQNKKMSSSSIERHGPQNSQLCKKF